jgi:hypothetical protein
MILNVSCDNLTKSKSEDTEESDSKSKKKKKKAADEEDEDVAADDDNTSDRNNDDKYTDDRNSDDEETVTDDESESRSRNNDDEDSGSGSWTSAEQREFMESCVEKTGFTKSKAESYCDCMLNKLQRKYPKTSSMEKVSNLQDIIEAMAPGCLN